MDFLIFQNKSGVDLFFIYPHPTNIYTFIVRVIPIYLIIIPNGCWQELLLEKCSTLASLDLVATPDTCRRQLFASEQASRLHITCPKNISRHTHALTVLTFSEQSIVLKQVRFLGGRSPQNKQVTCVLRGRKLLRAHLLLPRG